VALSSGTGKTFWLEGLGQLAVEAGLKVAWFSLEELGVLVRRHRADDSVSRAVQAILGAKFQNSGRRVGCQDSQIKCVVD
jgi:hypothetical protein